MSPATNVMQRPIRPPVARLSAMRRLTALSIAPTPTPTLSGTRRHSRRLPPLRSETQSLLVVPMHLVPPMVRRRWLALRSARGRNGPSRRLRPRKQRLQTTMSTMHLEAVQSYPLTVAMAALAGQVMVVRIADAVVLSGAVRHRRSTGL